MNVVVRPQLDTFPLSHRSRGAAEREFGLGRFERVAYEPTGPLGHCYWNVNALVDKYGGEAIYGWQILHWPLLYVEAMHHAVWRRPDQVIVDVTHKCDTDRRNFTVFIKDNTHRIDLCTPILIPNKYFALSSALEVQQLIMVARSQLDQKRALYALLIQNGATFVAGQGISLLPEHHMLFADEFRVAEQHSQRMGDAIRACEVLANRLRRK
jgi:hypothetical protein